MNAEVHTPRILFAETLPTPVGPLVIVSDDDKRVRAVDWEDESARMYRLLQRHCGNNLPGPLPPAAAPTTAFRALTAYFAGDPEGLDDIVTETAGTPFQQRVWSALRTIPLGQTATYLELARRIGRPTAMRAVGAANGANPISIIVPCHRVIGASGLLVGYAGGVERKRWLLDHERAIIRAPRGRRAARGSWG